MLFGRNSALFRTGKLKPRETVHACPNGEEGSGWTRLGLWALPLLATSLLPVLCHSEGAEENLFKENMPYILRNK